MFVPGSEKPAKGITMFGQRAPGTIRSTLLMGTFTALIAFPCSAQSSKTATIEGDLYVLTVGGDVKKGAANTVYLLRRDSASLAPMIATCQRAKLSDVRAAAGDSIAAIMLRAIRVAPRAGFDTVARNATVSASVERSKAASEYADLKVQAARAAVQTSGTGMAAHYKLSAVPFGQYLLFAEMQLENRRYRWWTSIDVTTPGPITRDLDNSQLGDDDMICPPPPPPPPRGLLDWLP